MVEIGPDRSTFPVICLERVKNILTQVKQRRLYSSIPLQGCISYAAFNLHVSITGGLPRLCSWCGPRFTRTLLLHSHVGIGLYLYRSNLLRPCSERRKILHSCYLSLILNFGSILFIAATKNYLPNWDSVRGIYSLVSSYALISIGLDLLSLLNQQSTNGKESMK